MYDAAITSADPARKCVLKSISPSKSQEIPAVKISDIAAAKLLMDVASLFSLNVGSIVERTIKKRNNKNKK